MGEHRGRQVAVKVLKVYSTSDFDQVRSVRCLRGILTIRIRRLTMIHVEVLQGSHDVEDPSPSECITTTWSDNG